MTTTASGFERLLPLLQLAGEPNDWEWSYGVVRNRGTGRQFDATGGILDLLGNRFRPTFTQRLLDTRLTAALYDYTRALALRMGSNVKSFDAELAMIAPRLAIGPGQTILDLACGHGNFTVEWAKQVGDSGLVVGLDISRAMLRRAVARTRRITLANTALVRGDALDLPFHDRVFDGVNCSGGFHQIPNLPRAIQEIARVLRPGGMLTASTFARQPADQAGNMSDNKSPNQGAPPDTQLHFIDLAALRSTIEAAGFENYQAELKGRSWGYLWARRCL